MNALTASLLLPLLLPAQGTPSARMPLGKDTTVVSGPLDQDGYVDYAAALNDRLSKAVRPEKNANALLLKALGPTPEGARMPAEYFKRLGIAEPPVGGAYFVSFGHYLRDRVKAPREEFNRLLDEQSLATARPWSPKDYPHVAGWLKANEKPLAVVVEATRRPLYFNPLVAGPRWKGPGTLLGALLPTVQKCRELVTALTARAMLRVAEGQFDAAWQDLLAAHRLGRLVGRGATLIESLVGVAIDHIASSADLAYLGSANLTSRQARACLTDLEALPPLPPPADKVDLAERFMYLDSVQLVRSRGVHALAIQFGGGAPAAAPEELRALERIDWAPLLRAGNRWCDRLSAAMRLRGRAEREKALERIDADLKALKNEALTPEELVKLVREKPPGDRAVAKALGDAVVAMLLPAVRKVQTAHDRSEQVQRNLRVAFALAAYRADRGGYPAKLADLAPKYLPAVPDDLFSGKPLVYRRTEEGYLFYSVGANGKDEGGRWYDDDPPGDDPRVRMPLPPLKLQR